MEDNEIKDKIEEKEKEEKHVLRNIDPGVLRVCLIVGCVWFFFTKFFTDFDWPLVVSVPALMGLIVWWNGKQIPTKSGLLTCEESRESLIQLSSILKRQLPLSPDFEILPEADIEMLNEKHYRWKHRVKAKVQKGRTFIWEEWVGITEAYAPAIPRFAKWDYAFKGREVKNVIYMFGAKGQAMRREGLLKEWVGGKIQ